MFQNTRTVKNTTLLTLSIIPFLYYIALYMPFFPNAQGKLGHDYADIIPFLVHQQYWIKTNGFFSIPWFSPHTGAGMMFFGMSGPMLNIPNLIAYFSNLSLLQLIQCLFFGNAFLGYWGFYLLLRHRFFITKELSLLGAVLFLFNTFSSTKAMVGHFRYIEFFYIPWFLLALLPPNILKKPAPHSFKKEHINFLASNNIKSTTICGIVLAYIILYCSTLYMAIPFILIGIGAYCLQPNLSYSFFNFFTKLLSVFLFGYPS